MGTKPILCLDFDGVIHSYTSGWCGAHFIPDPPVANAMHFLWHAIQDFRVVIFSSRSGQEGGVRAMASWIAYLPRKELDNDDPLYRANAVINAIVHNKDAFPTEKPPALVTIDDRAITFTGEWPTIETLKNFKPWNKK